MRIAIEVDDVLLERARLYSGIQDDSLLIHEALKVLIEREAARRLTAFGGSEPGARCISRRRMPR